MSFVSGCLYTPYNADTYGYRIPRVLHWLGQQQWYWIPTIDMRMNVAAAGYEWMMAPLMLFTHTNRFLFLINWVSYLMLPGLIFCVLRFSGVRARPAWWWSWLLACGWCYVMQSASVTDDAFATVYALAAVALAMKARETGRGADLALSLLAAALTTGVKQTDIPLVALWAIAACPQWRMALARPLAVFITVICGLLVSVLPITLSNFQHTGDWLGLSVLMNGYPQWRLKLDSPFWGIVGNAFCLLLQNLEPPFFPWSAAWNRLMHRFVQTPFGTHFGSFENFGQIRPGISEASAGIGLAIVLMALLSIWAAIKFRRAAIPPPGGSLTQRALRLTPWLLLLVFMAKDGGVAPARHSAAYYVFLCPSFLAARGQEILTRNAWWQKAVVACMVVAAGLLVVNVDRPLFPAETLLGRLAARHPQSRSLALLQSAYEMPREVEKLKRDLQAQLPANEPVIGFAGVGNLETEPLLWQPWGLRRVEWVLPRDTPQELSARGIHFVVIESSPSPQCRNLDQWMTRYHARIIADIPFKKSGHYNSFDHVYVLQLEHPESRVISPPPEAVSGPVPPH